MATTSTIPITITPEAAARVTALGMHVQFERMLEHTRQNVPGLRSIEVVLTDDPAYPGTDLRVVIDVTRDHPDPVSDRTADELGRWQCATFPPEVNEHFCILVGYGAADHAG